MSEEIIHKTTSKEYFDAMNKYIEMIDTEDAYKINDYVCNLEYDNKIYKEVIDKAIDVLNKMIYQGYVDGNTQYFATGDKSEFGVRAIKILDILKEVESDEIIQ